jgi:gas vesicle protein
MSNQIEGFIKGIILGGTIGAAIGILYAPQSGRMTRHKIDRKAKDFLGRAKEEYEAALKKSSKVYESAVKELKNLEASTKEKVGHLGGEVAEIVERGNEVLQDGKSRLKRALDAGVEAFKEEKTS